MNAHNQRWGKMRPGTLRLWFDSIAEGKSGRKNYLAYLLTLFRTGNSLNERERNSLLKYLEEHGLQAERLEDYVTVQYTHEECAAALECHRQQAVRHRNWAVKEGLLVELSPGRKGRPALFLVSDSPNANAVANEVTISGEIVTPNKVTLAGELGNNLSEMGSHQNSVTWGNADISRVIQSNPEETPRNFICPECGGTSVELNPNGTLYYCAECDSNTAYPVRSS